MCKNASNICSLRQAFSMMIDSLICNKILQLTHLRISAVKVVPCSKRDSVNGIYNGSISVILLMRIVHMLLTIILSELFHNKDINLFMSF